LIDRFINRRIQIIVLLSLIAVASSCLQVSKATAFPHVSTSYSVVRTADCHLIIDQLESTSCCPSRACHQTTPVHRNLGCPEYHSERLLTHPLTSGYRPLTPQFKAGQAIIRPLTADSTLQPLDILLQPPLQALLHLRSIVLLH
jgi:hypothetical protein